MSVAVSEKNITAEVASIIERSLNPGALNYELRKEAFEVFQKLGLPVNKAEEYKFTPITRLLEKNFNFTLANPVVKKIQLSDFSIAGLDANILVFINGVFSKE